MKYVDRKNKVRLIEGGGFFSNQIKLRLWKT